MTVYLDYNSTTPVDKRVLDEMLPFFSSEFGNAASKTHVFGWRAEESVSISREQVASFINASESEIIFTSGATESINLALKGTAEAYHSKGNHFVIAATEHKAVIDSCRHLEKHGKEISVVPVLNDGLLDLSLLESLIRSDTILVSVMLANNETGVIQAIREIAELVHRKGSLLFTDATQAGGKFPIDIEELRCDLLCLSAHKLYGPKGAGALYARRKNPRVSLISQIDGGGHERNFRSGTLNVPGIVGFGKACEIAGEGLAAETSRISRLRDKFEKQLLSNENFFVNGNINSRLSNTSNICFRGYKAERIISLLPTVAFATGSACSSALPEASHVLIAMGLKEEDAYASIRFSLGRFTTEAEIEYAIEKISEILLF